MLAHTALCVFHMIGFWCCFILKPIYLKPPSLSDWHQRVLFPIIKQLKFAISVKSSDKARYMGNSKCCSLIGSYSDSDSDVIEHKANKARKLFSYDLTANKLPVAL